MENYIKWLKQQEYRSNTIRRYVVVAEKFINWSEIHLENCSPFNPSVITNLDIQEWKKYILEEIQENGKKYSINTVNNKIESLKTFFRYLQDTHIISDNPAMNIKKQGVQKSQSPKWLNKKEKSVLKNYIDDESLKKKNIWRYCRNRAIVYIMLLAGLRISEVASLELLDIDNGYIAIRDGKGGKAREVYMNEKLSKIIREWLSVRELKEVNTNHLFISQKGGALTPSGIEKIFETIRDKTNLKDLTPHVLRHTCCHDLIENGVPINQVADIAGHVDLDTTRLYVKSSKEEQQKALDTLD